MRILLVGSTGSHLLQVDNLKPWWERHDGMRATFEKLDSKSLLAGESVTGAHHPTTRNLRALAQDFTLAWRLLRSTQPDVIVSGGGVAFVLPAGSAARSDGGLRGGLRPHRLGHHDRLALLPFRILFPTPMGGAASHLSQGRRHRKVAVRSSDARPPLLVTVGTNHHPFDRLAAWPPRAACSWPRPRPTCTPCWTGWLPTRPPFHDPFEHRGTAMAVRAFERLGRRPDCRTPTQTPSRGSGQTSEGAPVSRGQVLGPPGALARSARAPRLPGPGRQPWTVRARTVIRLSYVAGKGI
jgi:hypothetical protein